MQSNQLKNIQTIQNSLSLLKLKLQHMSKIQTNNQNTLHQIIQKAVPIIQKKIKQKKQVDRYEMIRTQSINNLNQIKKKNYESRIINSKQIVRSREMIVLMKQHNSLHLKQFTKQNEQKVKKIKELNLEQKRTKKQMIKQQERQSQLKIQTFYNQKQQQLKMKRQNQVLENEEKIKKLAMKMKQLNDKQNKMEEQVKNSNFHVNNFKNILMKVENMRLSQFERFKGEVTKGSGHIIDSKDIVEKILVYSAQHNI